MGIKYNVPVLELYVIYIPTVLLLKQYSNIYAFILLEFNKEHQMKVFRRYVHIIQYAKEGNKGD